MCAIYYVSRSRCDDESDKKCKNVLYSTDFFIIEKAIQMMITIKFSYFLKILLSLYTINECFCNIQKKGFPKSIAPSTGYIIAESDGGLSNRLRVLISHIFLAEALHNNAHLLFIWDINEACPGHFLQIFKPIPQVTFTSSDFINLSDEKRNKTIFQNELARNAIKIYPKSRDGFEQTMFAYDVNLVVKRRFWWDVQLRLWEYIIPTRELEEKIEDYVKEHNVCNMTR